MRAKKNIIIEKAKNIKLLAFDVDGVLTRGEIIFNNGEEMKIWNVKDGVGFVELLRVLPKIKTAWITGRKSVQIEKRAIEMNINYVIQNCMNKKVAFEKILKKNRFEAFEAAYIGDDMVDIPVLKIVGLSLCPVDACNEVKKRVDLVSILKGGEGVAREVIELIIKAKGKWKKILGKYK
ncbi:MAG: HAD hydrolase family protein [Endomicrobium sp.]|jgi:3-deoxy-D-manno-octulosonate 8-phosphate phosphatase (KDO 8-P phosphatase)|nr:HAD hydrolase family protein [Endomicrobium sp.]